MTRTTCLKKMRRLLPSIARREAYAERVSGRCEVGWDLKTERGDVGRRERHALARTDSWEESYRRAQRAVGK
jgi:hypothetical protein